VRRRDEHGSSTLFAVSCLAVLLVLGAALGVVAAMVHAHRVAQSAADLSALAAADAVGTGRDPCAVGAAIAAANQARVTSCRVGGREASVRVLVSGPGWLGQTGDLEAEARAGPASGPG
jgi:secretion/DNA translocation related TadE-like protein